MKRPIQRAILVVATAAALLPASRAHAFFAPSCFAEQMLDADWVIAADVLGVGTLAVGRGQIVSLVVRDVLYGDPDELPRVMTLPVGFAVSELGVQALGSPGAYIFLLFRGDSEYPVWSHTEAVSQGAWLYLPTTDATYYPSYERFAESAEAAAALRSDLDTPALDWGMLVASGVRSHDPLVQELALDWYQRTRTRCTHSRCQTAYPRACGILGPTRAHQSRADLADALAEVVSECSDNPDLPMQARALRILRELDYPTQPLAADLLADARNRSAWHAEYLRELLAAPRR